jgi:hypothetical protein
MLAPSLEPAQKRVAKRAASLVGGFLRIVDINLIIWVDKSHWVGLASSRSTNVTGYFNRVSATDFVGAKNADQKMEGYSDGH